MVQKLQVCEIVYFDQHFGFSKMAFFIPSHFSNVPYLNTKQLVDTTFWLKPISFGSNFFHLAKVLATTNSEPGLALPPQMKILNTVIT